MIDILAGLFAALYAAVGQECYSVELALTALCCIWLRWRGGVTPRWLTYAQDAGRYLSQTPIRASLTVLIFAVGFRLALLPLRPIPHPYVPDEFSHLLVGQTLLLGRLANPTPAMWAHFETVHEIFRPTYSSMYMPGQGTFLALGSALFGHPWFGILVSSGVFAVCLFWMLRGWFSAGWALSGTLLAVLRFGVDSYWINTYWGGFIPAAGGALLFGSYARLIRKPNAVSGVLLGVGIALLANTRPFEGCILTAFVLISLALQLYSRRSRLKMPDLVTSGLALLIVCTLTAAGMMTYFRAVTGSPVVLPYRVNQLTYGWPMTLPWYSPPNVELRHADLRDYYKWEVREHDKVTTFKGFLESTPMKLAMLWRFFVGPALTIPLLFLPYAWHRKRLRILFISALVVLACVIVEQSGYPHYYSPAAACIVAIELECLRRVWSYRRQAVGLIFLILLSSIAVRAFVPFKRTTRETPPSQLWCCRTDRGQDRAEVIRTLESTPGKHLVLVSFKRDTWDLPEWIYNDADIDASRIIWADDMGDSANAELIRYYAERTPWRVQADTVPVRLERYSR
jgi:hypothetical protein